MEGFLPAVSVPKITAAELKQMLDGGGKPVLVGVADREDTAEAGSIPGTTRIPLEDLMARHVEISKDATIVVYDLAGQQTDIAARYLVKQGRTKVSQLAGGVKAWAAAGYPVER